MFERLAHLRPCSDLVVVYSDVIQHRPIFFDSEDSIPNDSQSVSDWLPFSIFGANLAVSSSNEARGS
jgi:hypothetical protein